MRVLLLGSGVLPVPPTGWGAVERAVDGLSRGLRSLGVEADILQRVGRGRPSDEYRFALALPKMLRQERFDLLHASTPVVANRLVLKGLPYVYTSHSRHWNGPTHGLTQAWGFYLEKRACSRARGTIALTSEVADLMRRVHPPTRPERTRVIPNGVDPSFFRADWSVRLGHQVLGVGAVHPRKRWHLAARAVQEVPEALLTIVGPVQDAAYAQRVVKEGGGPERVVLTGEVPEEELLRRYATSDLLLHPSGSELLSISVLEAMASSLPVVGTTVLSGEVPGGTVGVLVDERLPTDPMVAAFRDALLALLPDGSRRRVMGEAGRRVIEERHSWVKVAEATLAFYRELFTLS
ncbi:MAG: glycosyltransferase family 4 protein [Euryarchaeota archaeon]|nr:glycosyltransferase family 4 protein [Euryarchaeota archaeon]